MEPPEHYLQTIDHALLTREEEITLTESGTDSTRKKLISSNLRLVVYVAKKYINYCCPGISFADLIQEGNIGLIRAADKFDTSRGYRFGTYAVYWIKQAIRKAILRHQNTIRVPEATQMKSFQYDVDTAPSKLFRDAVRVKTILPLDTLAHHDQPIIEDTDQPNFDTIAELCKELTQQLNERERYVIKCRYWHKMTLQEVGKELHVTRERIRQIEATAIKKMQDYWARNQR